MSRLHFSNDRIHILHGNALDYLKLIADNSVHCCLTSSDYWRQVDHEVEGQVGLLELERYLQVLADIFDEVYRVLVPGGTCFQVMADTKNNTSPVRTGFRRRQSGRESWSFRRQLEDGYHEKQPMRVPDRVIDSLLERGWCHRETMIWDKDLAATSVAGYDMAQVSHESIIYLFKPAYRRVTGKRPYANCKGFDRSVFRHRPIPDPVHICPFPPGLARDLLTPCVKPGDTVLDPFGGSGTTAAVALDMGCRAITGDLKLDYCDRIVERCGFSNPQSGRQVQQTTIFDLMESN